MPDYRIKRWRDLGVLCPGCRQDKQHAPQRYCAACLRARGVEPLVIPKEWLVAVRTMARVPPWVDPAKVAFDEQQAKRKAALAKDRARKAKPRKAKPKRPPSVVATIVESLFAPHPEEGEPLKRTYPSYYKPRKPRVPYKSERKYKRRFWTRTL